MLGYIMEGVKDHSDDAEIARSTQDPAQRANDSSGLIYGMGHAVYTKATPRRDPCAATRKHQAD